MIDPSYAALVPHGMTALEQREWPHYPIAEPTLRRVV
jgi:hypothetical protein